MIPIDEDDGPLTREIILVIRAMSTELGMSNAAIGRRFGMPRETIRDIVRRKTWTDIQ